MLDNEEIKFNKMLSMDPNPGTKDRCARIGNTYNFPGWVIGSNRKEITITYKNIKRTMKNMDLMHKSHMTY